MNLHQLLEAVMALPEKERLELARRIVASIAAESDGVAESVKGIEDVVTGKVDGLSDAEFRNALK